MQVRILHSGGLNNSAEEVPDLTRFFDVVTRRRILRFGAQMQLLPNPLHVFHGRRNGDWTTAHTLDQGWQYVDAVIVLKVVGPRGRHYIDMEADDMEHVWEYFLHLSRSAAHG